MHQRLLWAPLQRLGHRLRHWPKRAAPPLPPSTEHTTAELLQTRAELTRLQQRNAFLLKMMQRLGEAADEESLAALLVQLPGEILPNLAACSLIRFDEHRQPLPVTSQSGVSEAAFIEWHRHLSALTTQKQCAACAGRSAWAAHGPACSLLQSSPVPNVQRVVCFSLQRHGREFGVVNLFFAEGQTVADEDRQMLDALLQETTTVFENVRLRAREHQAILAERARLSREMHDGLAQTLGYLKMRAGQIARWVEQGQASAAAAALRELAQTANDAYHDVRVALDDLRQPWRVDGEPTFAEQLRDLAAAFTAQSGLPVDSTLPADAVTLPASTQAHLLRIAQESLTNIRKHAGATRVRIALMIDEASLILEIADDGQGFEAGREAPAAHYGLHLMRERAALLNADLRIASAPELGTRVRVALPL